MTREEQIREAAFVASCEDKPIYKREVVANGMFMATEEIKLRDCDRPIARHFFKIGAQWADANPCMPDKVVKIPERSREEIKELLANWKGTLVVCNDISLSPWISVEDRLPEPEKEVIILAKNKYIDIDHLTDDGEGGYYWWKSDEWICCDDDKITHWMPIPELPKEEKK
jgi:hypothetical protein